MSVTTFLNGRPPTRGLLWLGLSETGRVLTLSQVSDSGGGMTDTYTPGSDVACRIDALGGDEGEVAERISDRSTHTVTLLPGTTLTTDDDFQVDGVGRFEITAIRRHTGEMARVIEVTDRTS